MNQAAGNLGGLEGDTNAKEGKKSKRKILIEEKEGPMGAAVFKWEPILAMERSMGCDDRLTRKTS